MIKRTASDKLLRDKVFNIASDPTYDRYQRPFASIIYEFFNKKSTSLDTVPPINSYNQQLTDELDKPIKRKFKRRKVYSSFKDNF